MAPRISVIIFTLNSTHTVERAIESVLSQNCGGIELIVLEGCSRHAGSTTLGGNPDMTMVMAQERGMLAAKYLERDDLEDNERNLLLAIHGRSSLRCAWMSLVRGRLRITTQVVDGAIKTNPLWPLQSAGWLSKWLSDRPSAVHAL